MIDPGLYEAKRLSIQARLDSAKTAFERNRLGQFATPNPLARDVMSYALSLVAQGEPIHLLDPAVGTGSFFSALLTNLGDRRLHACKGFEVDPHYGVPARELWSGSGLEIEIADFTQVGPPEQGYNLLICNPPYVRHHHFNGDKTRLRAASESAAGVKLSGLSGLYCHFILLSHRWMSTNGIAGWLVPSEFMDVNYGRELKRYLLEKVTLLRIHRFDPSQPQFKDALVSSAVVWFKKATPPANHQVEFSYGGTHSTPTVSRPVAAADLASEMKWTRFPMEEPRGSLPATVLSSLFDIKRGIATGCNDFFIMSPERIRELRLPGECFRPILPSPRYVCIDEIAADAEGNPLLGTPNFLLDCRLSEPDVKDRYPTLWQYLESSKSSVASRYLCKSRKVWYWQENRQPAPFLCTYMGRGKSDTKGPFRFLLNHSRAIAPNTYLMLCPKPYLSRLISKNPRLSRVIWQALNEQRPEALTAEGRVYGGGLHKIEPKELGNLSAARIHEILAVNHLRCDV